MFNTTHKYCEYTFLTSIFRSERSEINMFEGVTIEKSNICTVIDGLKSSRKKCSLLVPNIFFYLFILPQCFGTLRNECHSVFRLASSPADHDP